MNTYRVKAYVKGRKVELQISAENEQEVMKKTEEEIKKTYGVKINFRQSHCMMRLLPKEKEPFSRWND